MFLASTGLNRVIQSLLTGLLLGYGGQLTEGDGLVSLPHANDRSEVQFFDIIIGTHVSDVASSTSE